MRGVKHIKGVADVRTAISAHYRNTSRTKGTPYLEILSLGMEKLRLESELEALDKRKQRIHSRLDEIRDSLDATIQEVQEKDHTASEASNGTAANLPTGGPWHTMKAEY
ncbi:MAG: hypothetical protein HY680_05585 [Chloroflexi bacterium]|nr:hypothetical protein [Chloroflexota bacterium]